MFAVNIQPRVVQKEHDCIPDEHYVQTLLAVSIFFLHQGIIFFFAIIFLSQHSLKTCLIFPFFLETV